MKKNIARPIDFELVASVHRDVGLLVEIARQFTHQNIRDLRKWLTRAYVASRDEGPLEDALEVSIYRGHCKAMDQLTKVALAAPMGFPIGMHQDIYNAFRAGVEEMFASLDAERPPIFGTEDERESAFRLHGKQVHDKQAWHHVLVFDGRNQKEMETWHCPKHWSSAIERMVSVGMVLPTVEQRMKRQSNTGGVVMVRLITDPDVIKHAGCHECLGETEVE